MCSFQCKKNNTITKSKQARLIGNPVDIPFYVQIQMYEKSYNEYPIYQNCRCNYKISRSNICYAVQWKKDLYMLRSSYINMQVKCMKFHTMKLNRNALCMQTFILKISNSICYFRCLKTHTMKLNRNAHLMSNPVDTQFRVPNVRKIIQWKLDFKNFVVLAFKDAVHHL